MASGGRAVGAAMFDFDSLEEAERAESEQSIPIRVFTPESKPSWTDQASRTPDPPRRQESSPELPSAGAGKAAPEAGEAPPAAEKSSLGVPEPPSLFEEMAEAVAVGEEAAAQGAGAEDRPEACAAEAVALNSPAAQDKNLDELWQKAVVEPPPPVIARWARSEPVREVLRHFVLEARVGDADLLPFRDVYKLLEAFCFSQKKLVSHIMGDAAAKDADRLADGILRKFASAPTTREGTMRFRDLFRLLEAMGITIRRFLSKFCDGCAYFLDIDAPRTPSGPRLGNYLISREIGSGFYGPCCYMAEHAVTRKRVAIKWPVKREELAVVQDIHKQRGVTPGISAVLACGMFDGMPYMVTDLLGSPFNRIFERLQEHPLEGRWSAVQVLGRLMVRRLEAVHKCGFVHCDVSPENLLLGPAKWPVGVAGQTAPYLIDFGLARRHPGGTSLPGDQGSIEWNSIRSADGGRRIPADDLEALGWVMVQGIFGDLPWFEWLCSAYSHWDVRSNRERVVKRVREAKLQLLTQGWDSMEKGWRKFSDMPEGLDKFLRACGADRPAEPAPTPDCKVLLQLLGGDPGLDAEAAEEEDLRQYRTVVAPLL